MTSKRLVEQKHKTVDSLHGMEFDLTQGNCLYDKALLRENGQNSQQPHFQRNMGTKFLAGGKMWEYAFSNDPFNFLI